MRRLAAASGAHRIPLSRRCGHETVHCLLGCRLARLGPKWLLDQRFCRGSRDFGWSRIQRGWRWRSLKLSRPLTNRPQAVLSACPDCALPSTGLRAPQLYFRKDSPRAYRQRSSLWMVQVSVPFHPESAQVSRFEAFQRRRWRAGMGDSCIAPCRKAAQLRRQIRSPFERW